MASRPSSAPVAWAGDLRQRRDARFLAAADGDRHRHRARADRERHGERVEAADLPAALGQIRGADVVGPVFLRQQLPAERGHDEARPRCAPRAAGCRRIPAGRGRARLDPSSSENPLIATLRAITLRSALERPAVMPKKKGAASIGLTIGKRPANVRRKALAISFMKRAACAACLSYTIPRNTAFGTQYERPVLPRHRGHPRDRPETARALAAAGASVLVHGRDLTRARAAAAGDRPRHRQRRGEARCRPTLRARATSAAWHRNSPRACRAWTC